MAREHVKAIVDFGNPSAKRKVIEAIRAMHGPYEVDLSPRRPGRSTQANRYYWAAVVTPLFDYLRDQDERMLHAEQAHEILKDRFLKIEVPNKETGEVLLSFTRSTTDLDTAEFSDYVERCRAWMQDFFGITTLDADESGVKREAVTA